MGRKDEIIPNCSMSLRETWDLLHFRLQRIAAFPSTMNCVPFLLLVLVRVVSIKGHGNPVLVELGQRLELSKTTTVDPVIPHLCQVLSSKPFIEAVTVDEEFFSSILYQLGFGVLGIRPDSWAEKYRADPQKPASCFASFYSAATADVSKSPLASSRRILHRCCKDSDDL